MQSRRHTCLLFVLVLIGCGSVAPSAFAQGSASEVEELKKQMGQMEEQLRLLRKKVEQMESKPADQPVAQTAPAKPAPTVAEEERYKRLEEKVDAAVAVSKKTFPSQFNPAI